MFKKKLNYLILAGTLMLSAPVVWAQSHQHEASEKPAMKMEMMQHHQMMMEKMTQNIQEMEKMVANMNAANGDKKVELMAQIMTKMVSHKKHMHDHMEKMHQKMMGNMMKMKGENQENSMHQHE